MYIVNMALQVVEFYDKLKQLTSCFGRRLRSVVFENFCSKRVFGRAVFNVQLTCLRVLLLSLKNKKKATQED